MKIIDTSQYIDEADLDTLSYNHREWFYNGLDCCVTLEILDELLKQIDPPTALIYQRSLDLRAPVLEMSMRGIRVDLGRRDAVKREFEDKHKFLSSRLNELFREGLDLEINYRSDTQLKQVFYDTLGLKPVRKRNANGQYVPTVNRDALEKLQLYFWAQPIISHILALRDLDKKLQFLRTGIDPDGRMRANFNIAGTNTGRLSSSESEFGTGTNQQNIDRSLRSIFIPDPGMKFINIDLEQGDSRNLGAFCWEVFVEKFGEAFAGSYLDACESGDLHTTVARMTWVNLDWPEEGASPKEFKKVAEQIFYRQDSYRQTAKKLGHGTNYLGQPPTMAMHTKMPVSIISNFQHNYFKAFPCIPAFHEWVIDQIKQYSQLTNLHGRRRFFFGRADDASTHREAVAYAGQSMTADAVNKAMLAIWKAGYRGHKIAEATQLLCQVHDSLLLQVPEDLCEAAVPELLDLGRAPLTLKRGREFCVPNEAKIGFNWGDQIVNKDGSIENELGLIKYSPTKSDDRKNQKQRLTTIGR